MSSNVQERPATTSGPGDDSRRPGELTLRELLRFGWRQLTSMRTALVLLLLLALAAVPGSLVPQSGVDSLKTSKWQDLHPTLTPIYERLSLFSVYGSPWFAAIYLMLMISLVGCIVPRTFVYLRHIRAQPPTAPRNLTRLNDHATYDTDQSPEEVLAHARAVLGSRRYRLRRHDDTTPDSLAVSAERGYLREVGNLVFHLAVLVVLVGFGLGTLFGYKGGVIVLAGSGGFSNNPVSYDDFVPGKLFDAASMEPFSFQVDDFSAQWLTTGPRAGMARNFNADISYRTTPDAAAQTYDLRVNHPLTIGSTQLFLIGHGYAPDITVTDGAGNVTHPDPVVFLPQDASFLSFGVLKLPDAKAADGKPAQLGLQGNFYPTFYLTDQGDPATLMGDDLNPLLSMLVYTGDLNMDSGEAQSIYALDTSKITPVRKADGKPVRLDLSVGESATLPGGLGKVTFNKVDEWTRIQISQSPGKHTALAGVVLALLGLLGSLFIRPRRVWVRARRQGGRTLVEVAALDRSGGGDTSAVVDDLLVALHAPDRAGPPKEAPKKGSEPA